MMTWIRGAANAMSGNGTLNGYSSSKTQSRFGTPAPLTRASSKLTNSHGSVKFDGVHEMPHVNNVDLDGAMNDSLSMEPIFAGHAQAEPSPDLYRNNPDFTAERRCRMVNWLLEVQMIIILHLLLMSSS